MRRLFLALLLPLLLGACGRPAPPEVTGAWARDTVGGTDNAAVFMTIASPAGDRLVAAVTPIARKTDLMTMTEGSGATGMEYLDAIALPAGKTVSLNPAGWHVWLSGLNQPLRAGQTFPLSLRFEKAGEQTITVSVIAPAAPAPTAEMKM